VWLDSKGEGRGVVEVLGESVSNTEAVLLLSLSLGAYVVLFPVYIIPRGGYTPAL
jgi:hypothetical protein